MSKIFIQIASYRDPELGPTIESIIKNADRPENLTFGICWQHSPEDEFEIENQKSFRPGFRIIDVPHHEALGVCWARSAIEDLYDGEEYTMQIDSHMRFCRHWDTLLKHLYQDTKEDWNCEKPLLTSYPPGYEPGNDSYLDDQIPLMIVFNELNSEGCYSVRPEVIPDYHKLRMPIRARFYAAGFAFTTGLFCKEVPHDPELYFMGEEMNIGARSFTHGYDLFHPHFAVCWHYYTREGDKRQWDDDPEWGQMDIKSKRRLNDLLGYKMEKPIEIPKYGFGNVRPFEDYCNYVGVDFGPIPKIHQSLLLGEDPVIRSKDASS